MVDRSVRDRFDLVFGRLASLFAAWPFLNSSFFFVPHLIDPLELASSSFFFEEVFIKK